MRNTGSQFIEIELYFSDGGYDLFVEDITSGSEDEIHSLQRSESLGARHQGKKVVAVRGSCEILCDSVSLKNQTNEVTFHVPKQLASQPMPWFRLPVPWEVKRISTLVCTCQDA